ncbi:MAG: hypothetical protein WD355_11255 [Balneolaceae bacterium]
MITKSLTSVYEPRRWVNILLLAIFLALFPPKTEAHEGPPFPIIIDEVIGPFLVSVWTDPDIGIGTFFVVFEPVSGDETPEITTVEIGVEPQSGRLEERVYSAESQFVRYGARYYAEVEFDQGEMWNVRVILEGPGWEGELLSEVEATPDGTIGPIGLVIYALPFVAIGIIWIRAMIRRREVE